MNKKILLIIACILVLTGCKKKVTCVTETKEYGNKVKSKIIATIKKSKVDSVSAKFSFENEKVTKEYCESFTMLDKISFDGKLGVKCTDDAVVIKNYSMVETDDSFVGLTKKEFKNLMEKNKYKCNK